MKPELFRAPSASGRLRHRFIHCGMSPVTPLVTVPPVIKIL
jgi:hypothetical protein